MSIQVGDNFKYLGKKPLDNRTKYSTIAEMASMSVNTLYDGIIAYCIADGKNYQWKSTNSEDATLGKWREFSTGGASDFDDLTNLPQESDTIDIDDLDLPMPAKPTDYPILFDETGTEYKVGLYKRASDGKVKPVYRKDCYNLGAFTTTDIDNVDVGLSNVDTIIYHKGATKLDNTTTQYGLEFVHPSGLEYSYSYFISNNKLSARRGSGVGSHHVDISIFYTKTTDEWKEV